MRLVRTLQSPVESKTFETLQGFSPLRRLMPKSARQSSFEASYAGHKAQVFAELNPIRYALVVGHSHCLRAGWSSAMQFRI